MTAAIKGGAIRASHPADPLTDPRRLPSLEQYALANAIATPYLRQRGLIDLDGTLTSEGVAALKADADSRHEDAVHRNIIVGMKAAHMVILGKLIREEELTSKEWRDAISLELSSMVNRSRDGRTLTINSHGRQVYGLAAGRTY